MNEAQLPHCWIRGDLSEYEGHNSDPVRKATHLCGWRVATQSRGLFGGLDHRCSHPAAAAEHNPIQNLSGGGIMAGGVDGYATFCEPVDMHLRSLGEPSRLIIDAEYKIIDEMKKLTRGEE